MSSDSAPRTLFAIVALAGMFGLPFMIGGFFRCQDMESQARRYRSITRAYQERYGRLPEEYLFNRKGKFQSRWGYEDHFQ